MGYDAIMVVVDRLSKMIRVVATNGEVTSEGVARIFRDRVWKDFGIPEMVISDRGSQFVSEFTRDLYKLLGVKPNPSMAYHHRQTDRRNGSTKKLRNTFDST